MSKNRRRGNGNTQACVLPRATLGLLLCSAQPIAQAAHRQKQQAFAYCLIPCLLSQFLRTIVRMLSKQTRAKNPTAISHARLFGEACYARERIKAKPQFRYIACLVVTPDGARGIFGSLRRIAAA